MLYNTFIGPIELIIDWVFSFLVRQFPFIGILGAIVGVSLTINFFALPIYNIADTLQDNEYKRMQKLKPGIDRIKSAFFGDERFMILQTFYKENHYHPIYAFKSSLSILIEIPFFIAAYHYLSNSEMLKESVVSLKAFGLDYDMSLASADHIFSINIMGKIFYLNILPILMTFINVFSGIAYTKGSSIRQKIQINGLALVFLILLYESPSGLVIYWILNNLFSLTKNIVKNQKNPSRILAFLVDILLIVFVLLFWILKPNARFYKKIILTLFCLFVSIFAFIMTKKNKNVMDSENYINSSAKLNNNFWMFFSASLGLSLLCGLALPASVISSDPTSFSFLGDVENPLFYIHNALFVCFGLFSVWPTVIYKMSNVFVKRFFDRLFAISFIYGLFNAFVFKHKYGTINILFNIDEEILQASHPLMNLLSIACLIALIVYFFKGFSKKHIVSILSILAFSLIGLSAYDIQKIYKSFSEYKYNLSNRVSDDLNNDIQSVYHLSKTGKNVLVFFLDQALSAYMPILQKENPEIYEKLDGFVLYPNTISYGATTLYGSPSMMGGYDYTPENINLRDSVLLQKKHNEATLQMPINFLNSGYNVTVSDPPLPNFGEGGDLTAFSEYPSISVFETKSKYTERYRSEKSSFTNFDDLCREGIINFSILQIMLPGARNSFYRIIKNSDTDADEFFDSFPGLYYLNNLTDFNDSGDTFTFIGNETPHFGVYLKCSNLEEVLFEPDCEYESLKDTDKETVMKYQAFAASIKELVNFFEYLKQNDCYDNTRIIVVSDHGASHPLKLSFNDEMLIKSSDILSFNPLLMEKDFNNHGGLSIDESYMTNADTIFLAAENLEIELYNPYTHTQLVNQKFSQKNIYFTTPGEHNPLPIRNKKVLTLKNGFTVSDSLYDINNWKVISK